MSKGVCYECLGLMESKHRHDFVECKCGESFLDGGDEYFRAGGCTVGVPDDYPGVKTNKELMEYLKKAGEISE